MRAVLVKAGATLVKEGFLQTRECFDVTDDCQWNDAIFGSVDVLYNIHYGTPRDVVNNHPSFVFGDANPFI